MCRKPHIIPSTTRMAAVSVGRNPNPMRSACARNADDSTNARQADEGGLLGAGCSHRRHLVHPHHTHSRTGRLMSVEAELLELLPVTRHVELATRFSDPDPIELITKPAWHYDAACVGSDVEIFFPTRGDGPGVRKAKAICAGCPVIDDCLDEALRLGERDGIRAGLTPKERRPLRKAWLATQPVKHGRARYQDHGCRCTVCVNANREYQRKHRRAAS